MKKILTVSLTIFLLCWSTALTALQLSLNQERFLPGETLILTLDGTWSGEADVYVTVSLPGSETWHFLTPSGFTLETLPYLKAQLADGPKEVFQIESLTKGFSEAYEFQKE